MPEVRIDDMRILVVDDHATFRNSVKTLMQSGSRLCTIEEASGGTEALHALEEQHIDVITLDLSLGNESGLDLLRSIHQLHPDVPVLMLTFRSGAEYAERSRNLGARGYLRKDLAASELPFAIDEVMAGRVYDSEARLPRV